MLRGAALTLALLAVPAFAQNPKGQNPKGSTVDPKGAAANPKGASDPKGAATAPKGASAPKGPATDPTGAATDPKGNVDPKGTAQAPRAPGGTPVMTGDDAEGMGDPGQMRTRENAKHAARLAQIGRIAELGRGENRAELVSRSDRLRDQEMKRHEKALARIDRLENKGHGKPDAPGKGAAKDKKANKNAKGKGANK